MSKKKTTTVAAPAVHAPEKLESGWVTVACKLPISGIELRLFELKEKREETMQGPKTVREAVPLADSPVFWIAGTAYPKMASDDFPQRPPMVNGAALTTDVPAQFWAKWLKDNERSDMVKNKMIFAYAQIGKVKGQAKDLREEKSGLEPMDPRMKGVGDKSVPVDRRMPRPTNRSIEMLRRSDATQNSNDRLAEIMEPAD